MLFRNIAEDSQVEIYFETLGQNQEPIAPSSAFVASDFAIYKNGSATAKATTNGITVTSPFNSETGAHLIIIDTSNDTGDSGFWTTGSRYHVKFNTSKTVDSKSIDGRSVPRGSFGIQSEYSITPLTASGVWSNPDRVLTAGTNIVLAKGTGITGFNDLDASGIRSSIGLASSNIDTQLSQIASSTISLLGTGSGLSQIPWNSAWDAEVQSECADALAADSGIVGLNNKLTSTRAGYLDSVILAQNSNRTVQITGSNHIAADVHAFQENVIDSGAISTSAVNKLQFGIATSGDLNNVSQRLPSGLINGSMKSYVYEIENDAINVAATDANLITWIQDGIATSSEVASVRVLTSGVKVKTDQLTFSLPNKVDINSSGIEVSGGTSLTPSDIRSAIGLASANLDTQLSNIPSGVVSYSMPESYAGSGQIMSVSQAMYMIHQMLSDFAINGAVISVKKLDGSEAASFRLDSASRPTSKERAS